MQQVLMYRHIQRALTVDIAQSESILECFPAAPFLHENIAHLAGRGSSACEMFNMLNQDTTEVSVTFLSWPKHLNTNCLQ